MATEIDEVGPVAAAAVLVELLKMLRANNALTDAEIEKIRTRAIVHTKDVSKPEEMEIAITSMIAAALS